jgi:signal transduction histidine kinase
MSDQSVVRLLRVTVALAVVLAVLSLASTVAALALFFATHSNQGLHPNAITGLVVGVTFPIVGALVVSRRRQNPIGWLFLVIGLTQGFNILCVTYAEYGLVTHPGSLPLAGLMSWLAMWMWAPGLILFPIALLLFPDGHHLSPHWRYATIFALVAMGLVIVPMAVVAWPLRGVVLVIVDNSGDVGPVSSAISFQAAGLIMGLLAAIASVVSLILRWRRSRDIEREQLKWLAFAVSVVIPIYVAQQLMPRGSLFSTVMPNSIVLVPIAIGVAILRYRLYDIDVVINKTVVVGLLAVVLAAIYVVVVMGVGALFGSVGGNELGLRVVATALVAIAFGPVRRRAQQWANRAVYGARVPPYEVLARFSHRAAEVSDDELVARIPRLVVDGTGAVAATLWVKSNEVFRAAAAWPEGADRAEIAASGSFEDPDGDFSLPVFHDGELLGGLSLLKTRGEALPPAEEQLVADLASGMGLALRNAGLTSQLRDQVVRLQASRERILTAADEARRTLERDLDSGPQQQLVALKVMLGPTRKQAAQAGATKTANLLAQLETDAGEAIRAVREFSSGVYPPLLEAEGLTVAVTQQTQKAALPIVVQADGLGRYSREIEAGVYFSILEALQNAAKYAGASTVSVALRHAGGVLSFEVTDDGIGFDPATVIASSGLANMADRLHAVGGTWSLQSSPGSGTTVRGTVPTG